MNKITSAVSLALIACVGLAACDDADDIAGIDDEAAFEVVLKPASSTSGFLSTSLSTVAGPNLATLSLESVTSITVPLGRVEAELVGEGWIDAGSVDQDVDLLALPADGIELVDGSLPAGSYTGLRFFLTGQPTITLEEELVVGRTTFEAGTHPLSIPSSAQTGLKLNALFEVDEDGQVLTVLFDGDASVRRVTATGSGVLKISPALSVEDEDGDDVGEIDDDDDVDAEVEFDGFVEAVSGDRITLTDGTVVVVEAETVLDGDLLSLTAVSAALAAGEVVEAEGEGMAGDEAGVVIATEIEFDVEDDDGDENGETEVEGTVTAVDRGAGSFVVDVEGTPTTVLVTADTDIDGDFESLDEMADAFEGGERIEAEAEGLLEASGQLLATDVDFEVVAEEFEGSVIAVTPGAVVTEGTFTVDVGGGETVVVAVTGDTDFHSGGDILSFEDLTALFTAGENIEAEGRGVLDAGVIVASWVKLEGD